MSNTTLQLPNYQITEQIYNGNRTMVYRGIFCCSQKPVVIKILRKEYPTFTEIVKFRNQYVITSNIQIEGIVQPIALENYGNGLALVMEDDGSISLSEELESRENKCLSLEEFFPIAIKLTEILEQLYRNRVIHKDIKPANILIHPETKQVKLIDFSISSLLPKEQQEIQNPNILEGTLAYISPEQTGRMNRGIDYRSDFYSLGVTFYELLTGKLPFTSNEVMELVHCHLAKMPAAFGSREQGAGSSNVPGMVGEIVMKLMAKNAEDRYQSALGLKYDLDKCWQQWRENRKIEAFALGKRDICDRFIIPEKLYGRENEVKALLAAFERVAAGNTEMMLVAGFSGIGKTAVVNEVHKPIVRQRGYFIKGKFDQFNRNIPFFAFVQAFRNLMGQLLSESDAQLQQWKNKILAALGENAQVVIEVIPELKSIIGQQPAVPTLSGGAAQNRFNLLFSKFIQVFTTKNHPLVIFLDDLQWADSASLSLMKLLMEVTQTGYLLILGAYRDNEVHPAHPFVVTLDQIIKNEAIVSTISLAPLTLLGLNHLIADTLSCTLQLAVPLTELVHQKTKGNPFFTSQFLKGLHEDKLITFNSEAGYWQCNIAKIRQLAITDDVVEFMATQLRKLPEATQEVLKLAACIGNQFDLATLAIVTQLPQEEVATALWKALQERLILAASETYKFFQGNENRQQYQFEDISVDYRFLHDRIQQAAYSLIPSEIQKSAHLTIGRLLLKNTPEHLLESRIFDVTNQLNFGLSQIQSKSEQIKIAQLNLQAGQRAKQSAAYQAALEYFVIAQSLLKEPDWQNDYSFSLTLHSQLLEAYYLNGQFEQVDFLSKEILNKAKSILDTIKVYEIVILTWVAKKQLDAAIQTGISFLETLQIEIPTQASRAELQQKITEISTLLPKAGIESLVDLDPMEDATALAAIRVLNSISVPAYLSSAPLFLFIVLTQVQLSINYGNCAISASAYARYGIALCGVLQQIELGYKSGQLALKLIEKFEDSETKTRTLLMVGALVLPWQQHLRQGRSLLRSAYQTGLESGNFEPAALACLYESQAAYLSGDILSALKATLKHNGEGILHLKQEVHLSYNNLLRQIVANLQGDSDNPIIIAGEFCDEEIFTSNCHSTNNRFGLFGVALHKSVLCYLFADLPQADQYIKKAATFLNGVTSQPVVPLLYWYNSLIQFALKGDEFSRQGSIPTQVLENLDKLKQWADYASVNFQHKFDLVEAEKNRVLGHKVEAIELYDKAIAGAKANEYLQEEALANELAAKFYLDWDKETIAKAYLTKAYYCYVRWGAKAKTDHLESKYPQLLQPILKQAAQTLNPLETLTLVSPQVSLHNSQTSSSSPRTNLNTALDFATVLKASQSLSGTIQLDELLHQLTQIILQHSGGDRCALILPDSEGSWQVRTIATPETTELCSDPLEGNINLPLKLIQYVKNTQEVVVIDNCQTDLPVLDEYLNQRQPKSVLCLPILNQGHLIGILYLKNRETSGVFTEDRILILNFLCTQAAISLENARLYNLEKLKTQQLSQLNRRLSFTQFSVDNAADGIFWICPDASFFYVNKAACTMLGYSSEELSTSSAFDISLGFSREQWVEHWQAIKVQGSVTFETRHQAKNGHLYPVEITANYLEFEGQEYNFARVRNISDRKQIEDALKQNQTHLEALLNNIPQMAWLKDTESRFIAVNTPFAEACGYPASEIIGKTDYDFWPAEMAKEFRDDDFQVLASGKRKVVEEQFLQPNGEVGWLETIKTPFRNPQGEFGGTVGIAADISDRKKAEIEREQHSTQLAQLNRELEQANQQLADYSQTLEAKVTERTAALKERETRLRLALSATNQGFFDVDLRTDEAIVSPEYALMLGYDPAMFQENIASWRNRLHPDDQEQASKAYQDYETGKTSQYKVEFRQRTQQGEWKWLLAVGKFIEWDAKGKPTRMLGTHTDISKRKLSQLQLEAQNELLAKIAKDEPLSEILNTLIEKVETRLDGCICSVLLLKQENQLRLGAAPSLPLAYNQAIDGILIGEGIGSCG
ncbi:MAG: AAA family ATPase, partial [Spirulinaceae cyanobacterium]